MQYSTIAVTESEGVGTITLNRPTLMNALNAQMRAEILQALRDLQTRARVLVLTGAGRAFCSGQDLGDGASVDDLDLGRILREEYEPMLRAINECPLPVIAAVNGAAAGAGANLALAADVVIATQSAVFLQAFSRIGLIPDAGGTYWLPRQIGFARAMGQALFAEKVTADEAAAMGMIWASVPDEAFPAEWQRRATQLAKGPTLAYGAIKRAMRDSMANTLDQQLDLEAELQGECGHSRDFREGVMAFLEKRTPRFEGR
ncbi:MAG: 2-(1,2-epoxy-1,2-dihydrophenyl)acetyl-CoA isomerase [Rhodobacteraceae bacterium HLUCCA12]|nr:MAG: 2-(1,2-epoxy-1,2-dihydrophenyl)acetyl-CoA isomerase [Rhodobacteraceae bacterium HLUCCA12]